MKKISIILMAKKMKFPYFLRYRPSFINWRLGALSVIFLLNISPSFSADSDVKNASLEDVDSVGVSYPQSTASDGSDDDTTALSDGAEATGVNALGIGVNAIDSDNLAIALGNRAQGSGPYSTVLGYNATATGNFGTVLGYNATATGNFATALGYNATASNEYAIALGTGATASAYAATVVGYNARALNSNAAALGNGAAASGYASIALGLI
ncbi:hypothetical protein ABID39_000328, partial [Bartonella japonica]